MDHQTPAPHGFPFQRNKKSFYHSLFQSKRKWICIKLLPDSRRTCTALCFSQRHWWAVRTETSPPAGPSPPRTHLPWSPALQEGAGEHERQKIFYSHWHGKETSPEKKFRRKTTVSLKDSSKLHQSAPPISNQKHPPKAVTGRQSGVWVNQRGDMHANRRASAPCCSLRRSLLQWWKLEHRQPEGVHTRVKSCSTGPCSWMRQ